MTTRIGAYGGPRQTYGSFAGKAVSGEDLRITRVGMYGGPRQLYGAFDNKTPADAIERDGRFTRIGMYGGPRQLYGPFDGKVEAVQPEIQAPRGGMSYDYSPRRSVIHEEEDEEILMVIAAFMEMIDEQS